jgi:hypothetical protein
MLNRRAADAFPRVTRAAVELREHQHGEAIPWRYLFKPRVISVETDHANDPVSLRALASG